MKRINRLVAAVLLAGVVASCSKSNESEQNPPPNPNTCDTANMKFATNVKPILESNCYGCHSNANSTSGAGVRLEDYVNVKARADNGSLIGTITHATGFPPMPRGGGAKLSDCNINKIKAWIGRGAPDN